MPASLRARLALTFALVVLISLAAAAASLVALLHGYSTRLIQARLDDVVAVVFIQARGMNQRGDSPAQVLDYLSEQADRLEVRILLADRAGRVARETGQGSSLVGLRLPLDQQPPVPLLNRQVQHGSFTSPRDRLSYQFSAVQVPALPGRVGEPNLLVVAQPEGPPLATLGPLLPRLALAAGAGLLGGLLSALLLTRWLGQPLARLLAATRALARGDHQQRVRPSGPAELVQLAESFNTMAAEVGRSRELVHRFVSTLSHELRTPLTSIRGFSTAVLDGSVHRPDELRRAMQIVDREARRMQRLTAELLDLSRLQAGQAPMQSESIDLAELVRRSVEVLEVRAQEQQVQFKLSLPSQLPHCGDADRLEQVFTNLLDNAVKFSPPNGVVEVRAGQVGLGPSDTVSSHDSGPFRRGRSPVPPSTSGLVIEVINPGPAIPTADLAHIFEQFYMGPEGQSRGGTGLGLPIAREIVRAHGGDISAESAAGLTTFRVLLPVHSNRDAVVTPAY